MYVILIYDISGENNGGNRLNKVFKTCKKYLTHIQKSVFEGELTEGQILKLKIELQSIVDEDIDSIILFKSRNSKWKDKEMWALQEDQLDNFI